MVYRILALDGGGCRAIIESTLIQRILGQNPCIMDEVDLFAGTSAGGILALSFAAGFSNEQTTQFYEEDIKQVFERSLLREFETGDSTFGAKYSNEKLKEMLDKQFGALKMKDLKRKVLVAAFQLDSHADMQAAPPTNRRWVPRFFHNMEGSDCSEELVADVAMRTSAAPTYFPVYQGYVDGGVFANNPSMCAITTAIAAGIHLKDIVVLSLSTGKDGLYLSADKTGSGDWGLAQWAPKLADLLLDAGVEVIDFQCAQLLGDRYHRINPPLPKQISLDEPKEVPTLIQLAEHVDLAPTSTWILEKWKCGHAADHAGATSSVTTQPGVPEVAVKPGGGIFYGYAPSCSIM